MDANWIPFHPNPRKPRFTAPAGAVDAHCHVFGPAEKFPFAPSRKYTPCDASAEQLFALRDFLGFSRNVIVQATCHGNDNTAVLDALAKAGERARGVVSLDPDVPDATLDTMHAAGVRGVRFNFVKRLVDAVAPETCLAIASRIARLGWHCVVYFEAADLQGLLPFLNAIPTDVVVDHMGRPDPAKGTEHPDFQRFVMFMQDNPRVWSKVTCPERLSKSGPPDYDDVVPLCRYLVERFPDRVLWGTDWPHPNMTTHAPDDGGLVDYIPRIAVTAELQHKLLVDNPMRLYWA